MRSKPTDLKYETNQSKLCFEVFVTGSVFDL